MTDCEHVLREIELFLDHELDPAEAGHIQQHLSECGSCLERKEFRVSLRVLVARKCGPPSVPDGLMERIRAVLAEGSTD
jgi:mycothiol system anti-sigma-R factor